MAKSRKSNPYPARFGVLCGVPWQGKIACGHIPWLEARLVTNLRAQNDASGQQVFVWDEHPKPTLERVHARWPSRQPDHGLHPTARGAIVSVPRLKRVPLGRHGIWNGGSMITLVLVGLMSLAQGARLDNAPVAITADAVEPGNPDQTTSPPPSVPGRVRLSFGDLLGKNPFGSVFTRSGSVGEGVPVWQLTPGTKGARPSVVCGLTI